MIICFANIQFSKYEFSDLWMSLCVMIVDSPTTAQNICRGCQKCILEMFF